MKFRKQVASSSYLCLVLTALLSSACGAAGTADPSEDVQSTSELLTVGHFSSFTEIPNGTFSSAPATMDYAGGTVVFAKGMDDALYLNKIPTNSKATGWVQIPNGTFKSQPSAVSDSTTITSAPTKVWLAARGFDDKIYVNPGNGLAVFPGWNAISDDTFTSAPALAFGGNLLLVVAQKSDGTLYFSSNDVTFRYDVANWTSFAPIVGMTVQSDPAAVHDGLSFRVVAVGTGHQLWTTKLSGRWLPWSAIPGGIFTNSPAIASAGGGHVDVFDVGNDGHMFFTSADFGGVGWNGFQFIPNATFTSGPGAYSRRTDAAISLMARGGDNGIWRSSYVQ